VRNANKSINGQYSRGKERDLARLAYPPPTSRGTLINVLHNKENNKQMSNKEEKREKEKERQREREREK